MNNFGYIAHSCSPSPLTADSQQLLLSKVYLNSYVVASKICIVLSYTDGQCLGDYNIGPDTKIHLVIRRPDASEELTSPSRIGKSTALWEELRKLLLKHFTSEDAEKVLEQFKKVVLTSWNFQCNSCIHAWS